jgi:hypothetical protein
MPTQMVVALAELRLRFMAKEVHHQLDEIQEVWMSPTVVKYSLCPKLFVVFGFHIANLTRFVKNTCNICISK